MLNKHLLRYEMALKGISTDTMAHEIGIDRSTFCRKCNGQLDFKLSEIQTIIRVLDLHDPAAIFFAS